MFKSVCNRDTILILTIILFLGLRQSYVFVEETFAKRSPHAFTSNESCKLNILLLGGAH
jgi:hypothetical protein